VTVRSNIVLLTHVSSHLPTQGEAHPSNTFWDRLVLSKIAARFGGNLKMVVSGAAPMAGVVAEWLKS